MQVPVLSKFSLAEYIQQNSLSNHSIVHLSIGSDSFIYVLFAEKIPERIVSGIASFTPTVSNTKYSALSIQVDWETGQVSFSKLIFI